MIDITLNFTNIHSNYDLGVYLSKELKFSYIMNGINSWDAYIDLFSDLMYKEFNSAYLEKDGWVDYQEYLDFKNEDKRIGQKNEQGVRDNLKLVFINFYKFYWQHRDLAQKFLNSTMFAITRKEEVDNDEKKDMLEIQLYIKS